MSAPEAIDLAETFAAVSEHWAPKIAARLNADEEAQVLIVEPSEVVNTGDAAPSPFTAPSGVRV